MSQMKRQDKTPEKQLNEVETGKLPGKRIQNNDRQDGPRSQENNGEDEEMFTEDLQELKNKQR